MLKLRTLIFTAISPLIAVLSTLEVHAQPIDSSMPTDEEITRILVDGEAWLYGSRDYCDAYKTVFYEDGSYAALEYDEGFYDPNGVWYEPSWYLDSSPMGSYFSVQNGVLRLYEYKNRGGSETYSSYLDIDSASPYQIEFSQDNGEQRPLVNCSVSDQEFADGVEESRRRERQALNTTATQLSESSQVTYSLPSLGTGQEVEIVHKSGYPGLFQYRYPIGTDSILLKYDYETRLCSAESRLYLNCSERLERYSQGREYYLESLNRRAEEIYFSEEYLEKALSKLRRVVVSYNLACLPENNRLQPASIDVDTAFYYGLWIGSSLSGYSEDYRISCEIPPEQAAVDIVEGRLSAVPIFRDIAQVNEQTISSEDYPCDDDDIQLTYDRSSPGYHEYGVQNKICDSSLRECTRDLVFSTMLSQTQHIVPSEDVSPVENCQIINVNLPVIFIGQDSIRTIIDREQYSATNYTLRNHFLHPGKVTRTVVERDTGIWIFTYGEGTGPFPRQNEEGADSLWTEVDQKLNNAVAQAVAEQQRLLP